MCSNKAISKFQNAPTSAKLIQYRVFSPVLKINSKEKNRNEFIVYEDENFIVKLQGHKLTQTHHDILDIIFYIGKNYKANGLVGKAITLYQIQKYLGHKTKNNHTWLQQKLEEIKRTNIQIVRKKDKVRLEFSILRAILIDPNEKTYAILLEDMYLNFFENFVSLNYKNILSDVLNLKNGVTKAAVRYFLTFKQQQINIDNLLKNVGVTGTERYIRKQRKILIEELEQNKEKFNIEIIKSNKISETTIKFNFDTNNKLQIFFNFPTQ